MTAVTIPFGIGDYKRADTPAIRLVNLYAESSPSDDTQLVLLPRPGIVPYQTLGVGPNRGLFQQPGALDDYVFTVSGDSLYKASTNIGLLSGTSHVPMAATINYLLIATGDTLRISDGTSVIDPGFPDAAGASSVAVLGGYSIAARTGTRRLYFTLDPTVWDGLDYLSAEQSTGDIIGIIVISDQLWVFCERTTEVFVLTGDSDAPLQSVQGRTLDKGALTEGAIAKIDNTVFWVGHNGIVYRAAGTPERISQHGIEERIAESDPATITAWAYAWYGHDFYVLNLSAGTFVYDAATRKWHECASYGLANWRAVNGLQYGEMVITGDSQDGRLWRLDNLDYTDDGTEVQRWFTALILERGYLDTVSLDCSVGLTPEPDSPSGIIEMRTSRDGGYTFTNWRQKPLGLSGQYRARPMWKRNGIVDQNNMLIQFRMSDNRLSRISSIAVNESSSGRGRRG